MPEAKPEARMKPAKIVSIEEIWRRSKDKPVDGEGAEASETLPAFDADTRLSSADDRTSADDASSCDAKPEVRFEKIIEAKERIRNNYYEGDRVGMDILRAIFGEDTPADDEGRSPQQDGDQDDVGDS